jgi:hypothetical protein
MFKYQPILTLLILLLMAFLAFQAFWVTPSKVDGDMVVYGSVR